MYQDYLHQKTKEKGPYLYNNNLLHVINYYRQTNPKFSNLSLVILID